jgi:uncharacterized alpha-E superfamily protein
VLEEATLQALNTSVELSRGGGDLPSRIADNLYWLGRYTERAESICRLSRVIGARLLEAASEREFQRSIELRYIRNALLAQTQFLYSTEIPVLPKLERAACESELIAAIVDRSCTGSMVSALRSAVRVSHVVRDRLSYDTLRILAALDASGTRCSSVVSGANLPQLVNELDHVILGLAGFSGLVMESMTRGFAWRFLDMGRRVERAIALVTLLRSTLTTSCEREAALLEVVLDVADSGMTYRRRYPGNLQAAPVVDLLVADDTNPRSVLYQLRVLDEHIASLPNLAAMGVRTPQQRQLLSARSRLELCDINEICRTGLASCRRDGLVSLLDSLGHELPGFSDSLTETYLHHASIARQLQSRAYDSSNVNGVGGGK